ncbi:MAG: indole-3-glycerol phosphate synthase TrpC [Ignavibacteriales bacterium]|nr:indole-3-glycerol phosphate synthase TrpC [Ignavibacteriales bacterium]
MTILQEILANKEREVERAKERSPYEEIKAAAESMSVQPRFARAIKGQGISIIAEIKKASPSRGVLSTEFDPQQLAREFEAGGARALSVLTDEKYFQGRPEFIHKVQSVSSLPVLRKDFIIDEYQIYESKVLGADAILLIVKALKKTTVERFARLAETVGLDVLVEAHTAEEVEVAVGIGAKMIGVNNRDLETFEVSIEHSLTLRSKIPPGTIAVSESGIGDAKDIEKLSMAGFDAVLIGEGIATKKDRVAALKAMVQA